LLVQRWFHVLLTVGALLGPTDAYGFCRKTTCKDCPLDPETGCTRGGQPLLWPGACVSYSLARYASVQVSVDTARDVVARAFDAWQSVSCPGTGEPPSIAASDEYGQTGCTLAEYSRTGANANVVLFRDTEWPYVDSEDALGLTTVSFDSVTGQIYDADIEVNSTEPLSTTDEVVPEHNDLLSILTHEVGHFLGLAHSRDPNAVMRPVYDRGTASLRVPNEDDIAGICSIYPPNRRALPCNFNPKGGFASECPLGVYKGGCAVCRQSTTAARPVSFFSLLAAGFAFAFAFRRVKKRRSPGRRAPRTQGDSQRQKD
jgi:hypothetical protein